jgi:hypothetical protein
MTPSVPSSRCRRALARAVAVAGSVALVSMAVSGCASAFRPSHHLIPGPSGAIAAAPLSQHRIAILAGSPTSKGVFIVDLNNGEVQKSFGVTREATGISTESGDGPLLISVGGQGNHKRFFGAVERWTLSGTKTRVVPMPAMARGVTRVFEGVGYVLVGNGPARTAIPLQAPALTPGHPIALEANAKTLQQCLIGASPYLLYSGGNQGTIVVREIETTIIVRSSVVGEAPICLQNRQQVFAISHSFAAASIAMLSLPTLLQQGLIPASNDAVALYETEDHHLIALNGNSRLSNIEEFSDSVLTPKPMSK